MNRLAIAGAIGIGATLIAQPAPRPDDGIFGFAASSLAAERRVEERFLRLPSESRVRDFHRYLTARPHVAGSARNRQLAEWQRQQWAGWGLEDVEIVTHDVLLPYPQEVRVELTAPKPWRASMREEPIAGDPDTRQDTGLVYLAYSASGEITAP